MSDVTLLRVLTRKSQLKFGRFRDVTVQWMLDNKKKWELCRAYYCFTGITFTPDLLDELHILELGTIPKPGKDYDEWARVKPALEELFLGNHRALNGRKQMRKLASNERRKSIVRSMESRSKGSMQRINQGHR